MRAAETVTRLALLDTTPFSDPPERIEGRKTQLAMVRDGRFEEVVTSTVALKITLPKITPAGGAATWRTTDPQKPAVIVGGSAPISTGSNLTLGRSTCIFVLEQRAVANS